MCFSALIQREKALLEKNYGALTDIAEFEKFNSLSEQNPKLYKSIENNPKIFSGYYAPVITIRNNKRVIVPMRYGVYPKPNSRYPVSEITYNARSDNLSSNFWSDAYMKHHGFVVIRCFYEWVEVKKLISAGKITIDEITKQFYDQSEARKSKILEAGKKYSPTNTEKTPAIERKIIIRFNPEKHSELIVPVIFNFSSHTDKEPFPGFAVITCEPNEEILNAGHTRMPVCINPDSLEEWLHPEISSPGKYDELLSNKINEYFTHSLEDAE